MTMHGLWAKFEPHHIDPAKPNEKKGQWRVTHCSRHPNPDTKPFFLVGVIPDEILVTSTRPYPKGCIVKPNRIFSKALKSMRTVP